MHFKPGLNPTIFTVSALIVLVFLGSWQVKRLAWKNNTVSQIHSQIEKPPIIPDTLEELHNLDELKYRRVKLKGEFLHDKEIYLFTGVKEYKGNAGYNILTPLKLNNGQRVLVDRGWVPSDKKDRKNRPETLTPGQVEIQGMLHKGETKGYFTPENDLEKNLWFWIDMTRISHIANLGPGDFYIRQLLTKDGENILPIAGEAKVQIRNDHLKYAITWYSLAIILLIIYYLYHKKNKR